MIPPPTQAEFWRKEGLPEFVRFWEVCNDLLDALNKLTLNTAPPVDKNESLIRTLAILTGIGFADVTMLVAHGHGMGAHKIARTCLEYAINAEYLRLNPAEYQDFLAWSWVEQHRKLNFMRKYMPAEFTALNTAMVADSEKYYQKFKSRFSSPRKKGLRQSWCKLNLRERAVSADFEEMYSAAYASASELSHGSFGGIAQHVERMVGDNWQPAIPPCLTGCALALQIAHYCTFRVLQTIVLLKGIESTPPRSVLKDQYDYVWQNPASSTAPRGIRIAIFGTSHRLQGAINSKNKIWNVEDPSYSDLLTMLFSDEKPDFVFEEVAGVGPTTASRKAEAELGPDKYLDIDPPSEERKSLGLEADSGENFNVNPMGHGQAHDTASWSKVDQHRKREALWVSKIQSTKFTSAILIVGMNHLLSLAYTLEDLGYEVKALSYMPEHKLCILHHT
jgi:hypothetical protein